MVSRTCPFCGGAKISLDVKVFCDDGSNFPLRAHYRNPKSSILRPYLPEFLLADLCNDCGSVVRWHVQTPRDTWETGSY